MVAQILPLPKNQATRINSAIGWFLWYKKAARIPRLQTNLSKSKGGLNIINAEFKAAALLLKRTNIHLSGHGDQYCHEFLKTYINNISIQNPPFLKNFNQQTTHIKNILKEICYLPINLQCSQNQKEIYLKKNLTYTTSKNSNAQSYTKLEQNMEKH